NAAVYSLEHPETSHTPGMNEIIREIMPAVHLAKRQTGASGDVLVDAAARENVRLACRKILADSPPLQKMVRKGEIKIIGAYKILASGYVEFF
ncbi:MAG: carbonic anhydrase, partial [Victivallales bacterium]|nr:carbonic anhydrase [Victivallales bacterium]